MLIHLVKENIETLCEQTTFELDTFLMSIFNPSDLFDYMKVLARGSNPAVPQHISSILQYEDFSSSNVSNEALEILRQTISRKLAIS